MTDERRRRELVEMLAAGESDRTVSGTRHLYTYPLGHDAIDEVRATARELKVEVTVTSSGTWFRRHHRLQYVGSALRMLTWIDEIELKNGCWCND